jgi:NAD(P)-dependent dehydrogenase (short-subunit alcohol dehydrogenase family)
MKDPADRTALVTGANKGIGFEIARQLGARGFRVLLTARDRARGEQAAAKLAATGAKVTFVPLDVSDAKSIQSLASTLAKSFDHLDVLVNNAGILENSSVSILQISAGEVERTWQTNTLGPLLVTQALAPLLCRSRQGAVINLSSGWGALHDMTDEAAAYGISKAALNAVTRQFADALKAHGVTVNSVCPGWVRTDMGGRGATREVDEGADTAVWLATDAPRSLTGQFLRDRKSIPW